MKTKFRLLICAAAAAGTAAAMSLSAFADTTAEVTTSLKQDITDIRGQYPHWDGVTSITQFKYYDGTFCLAMDGENSITIMKISSDGKIQPGVISLAKAAPEYGTVLSDSYGNFYAVTGKTNDINGNRKQDTIFISKYNKNGQLIATAGDDGSSSLQYYHDDGHNTRLPFDSGVSAAISGNVLAVNYGRFMYNGHQANSIWAININTMNNIRDVKWISTHSFAHRAIAIEDGFVFVSEGDCYERAFSIYAIKTGSYSVQSYNYGDPFHFWVQPDALKNKAYGQLNANYAHLAGIVPLKDGQRTLTALVGTSAPSLNEKAPSEREKLFIQIFDPFNDLSLSTSYVTQGTRTGLSGGNGDQKVTDKGVQWLDAYYDIETDNTGYKYPQTIENPQVVVTEDEKIVILYEKGRRYPWTVGWHYEKYDGLFYIVLNADGSLCQRETLFSKTARLNPCEMPVYTNGSIYWVGNVVGNKENVYINILTLGEQEEEQGLLGDVNSDGTVNFYDASLVLAYSEGNADVTMNKKNADVNGDGSIDRKDAELIQKYAAGNTNALKS